MVKDGNISYAIFIAVTYDAETLARAPFAAELRIPDLPASFAAIEETLIGSVQVFQRTLKGSSIDLAQPFRTRCLFKGGHILGAGVVGHCFPVCLIRLFAGSAVVVIHKPAAANRLADLKFLFWGRVNPELVGFNQGYHPLSL